MDSESCPDLGGRPPEAAESEMTDSVPEDGRRFDASGSAEDRGKSSSGSVDFDRRRIVAEDGSVVFRSKLSEPYFLRRVLREELGGGGGGCGGPRLLAIAVHAVMQESGFVAVDSVTGIPVDRFHLPDQWESTVSLSYSLPEVVDRTQSRNTPESVILKFQSLGHFMVVYGSLPKAKLGLRRVCLDERIFTPTIELLCAQGDDNAEAIEDAGSSSSYPVKGVFEFWKIVKYVLALPLLMDLTERVGLPLPSCFTCLPTELKFKIFESLNGIDLARVACVCSELRDLTSCNDLWKQKYVDEFGERTERINWKQSFAKLWKAKKKGRGRVIGGRRLGNLLGLPLLDMVGVEVPHRTGNWW